MNYVSKTGDVHLGAKMYAEILDTSWKALSLQQAEDVEAHPETESAQSDSRDLIQSDRHMASDSQH